ncbi:MAG: hypothetical protein Fur0022_26800 [Anaerolineales bacterium]
MDVRRAERVIFYVVFILKLPNYYETSRDSISISTQIPRKPKVYFQPITVALFNNGLIVE